MARVGHTQPPSRSLPVSVRPNVPDQSGPSRFSRDTELVPIGVREHEPRLTELLTGDRGDTCRPELFQAMDLLEKVVDEQVEMHAVLHRLALGDALQGESDALTTQRDEAPVELTVDIEGEGGPPERCSSFQVATVQGELDPHPTILVSTGATWAGTDGIPAMAAASSWSRQLVLDELGPVDPVTVGVGVPVAGRDGVAWEVTEGLPVGSSVGLTVGVTVGFTVGLAESSSSGF